MAYNAVIKKFHCKKWAKCKKNFLLYWVEKKLNNSMSIV